MAEVISNLSQIPAVWGIIYMLVTGGVVLLFWLFKTKNIKFKDFEIIEKEQKEKYRSEGKNTLDNQSCNAHNILKKIWIMLYSKGKDLFNITNQNELFLLEDITKLIECKLNYGVKNDLTKNHITEKDELELTLYSDAKASRYYQCVKSLLYQYNLQLPAYNLPEIMDEISIEEFRKIFKEIYSSAKKIAGGTK
jgi:hypothetical protein